MFFVSQKKKTWLFELICFKEDLYFILFFSFKSYKLDLKASLYVMYDFFFHQQNAKNNNIDLQLFINDKQ